MSVVTQTQEQRRAGPHGGDADGEPQPGLLLVFTGERATLRGIPLEPGVDGTRGRVLGRGVIAGVPLDDACMSRRHAEVSRLPARGDTPERWRIADLGSRNGTFVDGDKVRIEVVGQEPRLLRTGDSLFVLVPDLRPFAGASVELRGGVVVGPTLAESWGRIARAAASGDTLHLSGRSGSGKELAARHFHDAGRRARGPFVAVNCATVPQNLAERLLFGARKGAYSDADADAEGYVQAAHGGTLFLDEIAELEPAVQAKLLRVLETREVLPLGATRPRPVELALCSATHRDLRAEVAAGRFREDLFFRIARPQVALPSLAERVDDFAALIERALGESGLAAHVALVEQCLLRPWPGNVRELLVELRHAAAEATASGSRRVEAAHLPADAGRPLVRAAASPSEPPAEPLAPGAAPPAPRRPRLPHDDETVRAALAEAGGRVATAARALGWHRTQLRRWIERQGGQLDGLHLEDGEEPLAGGDDEGAGDADDLPGAR